MQLIDQAAALASEKVILESLLLDNEIFYQLDQLTRDDFQTDCHRKLFSEIAERITDGQQVDESLLLSHFHGSSVGDYILRLDGIGTRKITPHVEQVRLASQRRKITRMLQGALQQAQDASKDNEAVLSVTYDALMNLGDSGAKSKSLRLSEFSDAFYDRLIKISGGQIEAESFTTSLQELDELTGGLFPGEFVVVGGWTNEGKTPFVQQIIAANCEKNVPCLLFSQEMTKNAVLSRCIPSATKGQITGWKLRNPKRMNGTDCALLLESKSVLDRWPLWVNDASSVNASEMTQHATAMIRRHGIRMVVVDYIQLMQGEGDNRAQRVSSCSAALRELAKNQKVVVIGVSQFGRPSDKMKRRPVLFDLKESGDTENDAHLVMFVYRPVDKKSRQFTMKDEIIVAKQREGTLASASVVFDGKRLVFLPRFVEPGEKTAEHDEEWYQR